MVSTAPKLGIIAGGGHVPTQLIAACERQNRPYFIIALQGQADADLATGKPHVWVHFGEVGRLKEIVAEQKIEQLVMIGRVRRPSITEVKPDWLGIKALAKIGLGSLGDDALLRSVGTVLSEATGAKMIGVQDIFADLITPIGVLGRHTPDKAQEDDIRMGIAAARDHGRADLGQAVIVQQGVVLGLEEADGTDALIARVAPLQKDGPRAILVKMAKPQQDDRFDLPSMGIETLRNLAAAGMAGVVIEAGRSLFVDRGEAIKIADDAGLFVVGVKAND